MPGQDESLVEAYNKWRGWADEKVCCDYGLKVALPGEITEDSLKEMKGKYTQYRFIRNDGKFQLVLLYVLVS